MRIIALLVVLLICSVGSSSATVSYNLAENIIYLENGTSTLANILTDVNNNSVISYSNGTYTLSATISGKDGATAHLHLKNTTLIFNNTAVNSYYIKTWSDLVINNMTIKPVDYSYPWLIHSHTENTDYSVFINSSDFSGGRITAQPPGYGDFPSTPTVISNNIFHDTTLSNSDYMLNLGHGSIHNGTIYNNTFENIHLGLTYNGVLKVQDYGSAIVEKLYIYNSSAPTMYGMVYMYGSVPEDFIVTDFEIKNIIGDGISGKEYGIRPVFKNGVIENVSKTAIRFYLSDGTFIGKVWNVNITDALTGIESSTQSNGTIDIYNVKIDDVYTAFDIELSKYYVTNSLSTNYTNQYTIGSGDGGEFRDYMLADIYITDTSGTPIEGATIDVTPNSTRTYTSMNRDFEEATEFQTLSNGHTALPNQSSTNTIALMRAWTNFSITEYFNYTISATKTDLNVLKTVSPANPFRMTYQTNSTIIVPYESWYRSNPNTYQNTTNLMLEYIPIENETFRVIGS